MSSKKSSVLLDVDRSIIENNLLLQENRIDGLEDLFPRKHQESDDVSWKLVKPTPGMCVKTRTGAGEKVFINICKTPEIPVPEDITEEQLVEIWSSEEHSSFRVPMSIGEAHLEEDKSGNPLLAYDVAINPKFFKKVQVSKLFKSFLLTVVMEGLQDKYSIELETEDYVILKNRKAMGQLQHHRVRQEDNKKKPTGPLIEEVFPPMQLLTSEPPYRIRSEPPHAETPEYLLAEFILKGLASSKDVTLDIGEDRILLDSPGHIGHQGYKLDVFIPYNINQEECSASFHTHTKVLSLKMPLVAAS